MEWIIGLIAGLLGGGGACYVLLTNINKKSQQKLIEQSNQKSDLILEQAKNCFQKRK